MQKTLKPSYLLKVGVLLVDVASIVEVACGLTTLLVSATKGAKDDVLKLPALAFVWVDTIRHDTV